MLDSGPARRIAGAASRGRLRQLSDLDVMPWTVDSRSVIGAVPRPAATSPWAARIVLDLEADPSSKQLYDRPRASSGTRLRVRRWRDHPAFGGQRFACLRWRYRLRGGPGSLVGMDAAMRLASSAQVPPLAVADSRQTGSEGSTAETCWAHAILWLACFASARRCMASWSPSPRFRRAEWFSSSAARRSACRSRSRRLWFSWLGRSGRAVAGEPP